MLNHVIFYESQAFVKVCVLCKLLVELEPLVIGRVKDPCNIGFAFCRVGPVDENKIEFLEDAFRPLVNLFLENLPTCSKSV
uniref:Uncharacterized protein n=1 Tax=Rhizophora mucronata TaxID=61149 RepID=A0A2P2QP62_RHIMU